jgi:hypothetical protein
MLRAVYHGLVFSDPNPPSDSSGTIMSRVAGIFLMALVFSSASEAQKGTAPSGYYPPGYFGATFTGSIEPPTVDADAEEIVLVYTKATKSERFTGRLEATCAWTNKDGTVHGFRASNAPKGAVLTAFYIPITTKLNGQKSTENSVIAISYAEVDGKKIPDDKRIIVSCSAEKRLNFKFF